MSVWLFAAFLAAPCRAFWLGSRAQSRRLDHPVLVSGQADDWPLGADSDEYDGLSYAFANDERRFCAVLAPHTKEMRAQMAGLRGQDFTFWLDPKGASARAVGLRLAPPEGGNPDLARSVELVGIQIKGLTAGDAQWRMGPVMSRGIFEVCVPLSWLGSPTPKKIGVGFAAAEPATQRRRHGRPSDLDDALDPLFLWVQVKLAPPDAK